MTSTVATDVSPPKSRSILTSALLVVAVAAIASAVGFYFGVRHGQQRVVEAIAETLSATAAEPEARKPEWRIGEHTDRMTDQKAFSLSINSDDESKASLYLSCSPQESVSIFFDRLHRQSDDYYVNYRIDQRSVVKWSRWSSGEDLASPPDKKKFIAELVGAQRLLVDIYSAGSSSYSLTFDITGYDEKLAEFRGKCATVQQAPDRSQPAAAK